ncbi:hypothetical protein EST38_g3399 [Candolleomyces aberdarensis]|uniref:BHLH domain-containing protein n=1 Tax=Candolleomyces aberdarensis TaxID=2316362 RepID=A0A4Q2DTM1_9AGAR|nr:hypothetical protein EST38_g3399 [Candolleomyces aberdarensis]
MSSNAPDPAVAQGAPPTQPNQIPQVAVPLGAGPHPDYSALGLNNLNLEPAQILKLLRSLPGVFTQMETTPNPKQDAAQTLSNLSQNPFPNQQGLPVQYPPGTPGINDPGPSSHPRGPPNLGQLSAVAMQAAPAPPQGQQPPADPSKPVSPTASAPPPAQEGVASTSVASLPSPGGGSAPTSTGGRRGRNPAIGTDEWTRQRKDNHKEVERRRRGNINDGINELGRIVPNGTGEKAKGAILARAVQYIHHLKENEARNIEKWTLEKLLMDQAMGDLQAQLEEVKRLWDEERTARQRLERELELLRGGQGLAKDEGAAPKRRVEGEGAEGEGDAERDGKRQRTD